MSNAKEWEDPTVPDLEPLIARFETEHVVTRPDRWPGMTDHEIVATARADIGATSSEIEAVTI